MNIGDTIEYVEAKHLRGGYIDLTKKSGTVAALRTVRQALVFGKGQKLGKWIDLEALDSPNDAALLTDLSQTNAPKTKKENT